MFICRSDLSWRDSNQPKVKSSRQTLGGPSPVNVPTRCFLNIPQLSKSFVAPVPAFFSCLNIKYLVFVVFSIEYRLKRICKSLYPVFIYVLHNLPTSLELELHYIFSPASDGYWVSVGSRCHFVTFGQPPISPISLCSYLSSCWECRVVYHRDPKCLEKCWQSGKHRIL